MNTGDKNLLIFGLSYGAYAALTMAYLLGCFDDLKIRKNKKNKNKKHN